MTVPARPSRLRRSLSVALVAVALVLPSTGAGPAQAAGRYAPAAPVHPASSPGPTKSIGLYVGKNLTDNGSALLGGFGQEPSSHWLEIVPRRHFPEGATTTVGVTGDADLPGRLTEIPQARDTAKYVTSNYSEFAGFPAPLTNGGLNEHGVAARDIWSPTNQRLLDLTKKPQTGPNYSDLSRIAMERAHTAREAVEILGSLIDRHGYSSYGGNSHLFADRNEGWIFVDYGGNRGLWAAERLGPNEVRASFPGYLNPFPLDYRDHPEEYLASDNLIDFAVRRGWFDRGRNTSFDVQRIYGDLEPSRPTVSETHPAGYNDQARKERELRDLAPVSLPDMLAYVRDPRWSHDRAGYGQVAQLHRVRHRELNTLWTAVTGAVSTPYVPIYLGARDVPPEYKQHRYLTHDAASTHLAAGYAPLEATRYATRTFKRLMYHTCTHPERFLKPVTAELEAFESRLLGERARLTEDARRHLDAGRTGDAHRLLTDYVGSRLLDALSLGEKLVETVERRTREEFGIRRPAGRNLDGETYRGESQSMNRDDERTDRANDIVSCYREGIDDYPREHGSYRDLAGRLVPASQAEPAGATTSVGVTVAAGAGLFALGLVAGVLLRGRRRRET